MGGTGDKGWYDLWITEAYILEKNYRNLDLFLSGNSTHTIHSHLLGEGEGNPQVLQKQSTTISNYLAA